MIECALLTKKAILIRAGSCFEAVPVRDITYIGLEMERRYSRYPMLNKDWNIRIVQKDQYESVINNLSITKNKKPEEYLRRIAEFYEKAGISVPVSISERDDG
ncbi:MAG: hypothetical protein IK016_09955 [Lachnospiraceae bacterium]|nr:hypothetical protein [Lachnospiraceae bacterium]